MSAESEQRSRLFRQLSDLPKPQFEELLFALDVPNSVISGMMAAQGDRVADLLNWAKGATGCGLETVSGTLRQSFDLKDPSDIDQIDFAPYLRAILKDHAHYESQNIYTSLRAEKVKEPSNWQPREPEPARQPEQAELWDDVLAGVRHYSASHVLLVGKPGSGKSTALKQLLWEEAQKALAAIERGETDFQIPVFIELRDRKEDGITVRIQKSLRSKGLEAAVIEKYLLAGRFFLMFDGLNEIPSDSIWANLSEFQRDRDFRKNPRVFTTRELGADSQLDLKEKLTLLPLTEPQMRVFVGQYLPGHADLLLNQLKDRLKELAETPLLLKILCDVIRESPDGKLPQNRGELFRREFARRYEAFKQKRGYVAEDSRRLTERLLQHLAFKMTDGKSFKEPELQIPRGQATEILKEFLQDQSETDALTKASEYLEDLLEWDLLQVASDPNKIEFHHQLFQEYYAAEYLLRLLPTLSDDQLKQNYLNLLKWTEPIALMLSLVDEEKQALQVVKLAIDDVDLMLGARLSGEAPSHYQEKTVDLIIQQEFPQWLEIELLGQSKTEVARRHLFQHLSHPDIELVRKAAAFIGETNNQEAIDLVGHRLEVIDAQFFSQKVFGGPDRTGNLWTVHVESLAHLAPNRSIEFLRSKLLLDDEVINYDLILHHYTDAAQLLMYLDVESFLPIFIKNLENTQLESQKPFDSEESEDLDESDFLRNVPIEKRREMAFNNQKSILLSFIKGLHDHDLVNSILVAALERENSSSTKVEMIRLFRDDNNERVDQLLTSLLSDENFKVQKEACSKLISRNTSQIEQLKQLLEHSNIKIAWAAAFVLGNLGHEIAFPILAKVIRTRDLKYLEMQRYTAQLLGVFNPDASAPILMEVLTDESRNGEFKFSVRSEAAHSLAEMGCQEAVPELLREYRSGFRNNVRDSIRSLAKLGLEEELWTTLRDRKLAWQTAAVELSKLGHSQVLPDLRQALISLETESANNVIGEVAKLADLETIDWLLDALRNPEQHKTDRYFLNRVAFVLVECDTKLLEKRLQSLVEIARSRYVEQLSWVIPSIQSRCQFYNYEIWQETIANTKLEAQNKGHATATGQTTNIFAPEVKIFERVDRYYEHPPDANS